jgi:hypothetical protein
LGVGSCNHTPTMVQHERATAEEVRVQTLDSALEEMGVDKIDLMKIDTEGHEPRVLRGAQKMLREGRVRAVLCEFNEHWLGKAGSSPEELEALITGKGLIEVNRDFGGGSMENRFFSLA